MQLYLLILFFSGLFHSFRFYRAVYDVSPAVILVLIQRSDTQCMSIKARTVRMQTPTFQSVIIPSCSI